MRWLADECIDAGTVRRLRAEGHDVAYIAEFDAGATDAEIVGLAHRESRVLLTEDKDFGELVFRRRMPCRGLVLLRLPPHMTLLKWTRLQAAIARFAEDLATRFLVVEETRMRSRLLAR
jgi:predicted nuclease of predicted toxin-antitoxin system